MKIERRFTRDGADVYADLEFTLTSSEIRNPDGTIVFKLDEVEVPKSWSQVASDVIAQKYFRKAGVPARLKPVKEKGVPDFFGAMWRMTRPWPSCPKISALWAKHRQASVPPFGRGMGLLGMEGRLFLDRGRCARLFRRNAIDAGAPDGRAKQPAVVQHRPPLGLWH